MRAIPPPSTVWPSLGPDGSPPSSFPLPLAPPPLAPRATESVIVQNDTIPELVQLAKTGSQKAQEMAAAGLSDLAKGAIA